MKKNLLVLLILISFGAKAQFSAGEIWSLNLRVEPILHNSITVAGIQMGNITYDSKGVPLTGLSNSTMPGIPIFRITSTVNQNTTICISGSKEDNDPWEDTERATFTSDATGDTSIVIERSNNGSPFTNSAKITIERGSDPNQFVHYSYRWMNDAWELNGKSIYYLSNNRIDSLVGFKVAGSNFTRNSYTVYYYSNGLDSSLQNVLQTSNNEFELANKVIVTQKASGKTKAFAVYARNGSGMPLQQTGTVLYNNNAPNSLLEVASKGAINLYPNPAKNQIKIEIPSGYNPLSFAIYSHNGALVQTTTLLNESIDISDLSAGIYFLNCYTQEGLITQKFIKN
ncbi:MAG: T9SS type A sorting domain-containing protein [Bacteroidia bacterium]